VLVPYDYAEEKVNLAIRNVLGELLSKKQFDLLLESHAYWIELCDSTAIRMC
jgi:hypothetical protein